MPEYIAGTPPAAARLQFNLHAGCHELGQVLDMAAEYLVRGNHRLTMRERVFENFGRRDARHNELDHMSIVMLVTSCQLVVKISAMPRFFASRRCGCMRAIGRCRCSTCNRRGIKQ